LGIHRRGYSVPLGTWEFTTEDTEDTEGGTEESN
jgi:hypothetical protein